ncbi:MAG: ATP-dependent zinc metalloprotease FtsH [Pseudomonadales bacterium]
MPGSSASERPHETRGFQPPERRSTPPRPPLGDLPPRARFSLFYYLAIFAGFLILQWLFFSQTDAPEWSYSAFLDAVQADKVAQVVITEERIYGQLKPPAEATPASSTAQPSATTTPGNVTAPGNVEAPGTATAANTAKPPLDVPATKAPWHLGRLFGWWQQMTGDLKRSQAEQESLAKLYFTVLPLPDPTLLSVLQAHGVDYRGRVESHLLRDVLLNWIVPFGIMFLIWGLLMRRMGRGPSALQMGKSRAKIYEVDPALRVRFSDVAGVDEAIEETREIVAFLKDPAKFTKLGAKLPKGVLLVGPPGTGKTLLARAIAGESEVPFYSLSGSDFVEMFVGVGAARVRDLFEEAKKAAPCIVFIDELDAVGKARAQGGPFMGGGYDERENTLNQLLTEMDGFDGTAGVIILAATNRPEILDPALLRAGRFDRRVVVDRPSRAGRKAIFLVHTRKLPVAGDVDFDALAAQTPGMVGADIANVCNEAALLASRRSETQIGMPQFQEAIERILAGPQKKSLIVTPEERRRIAYHESGHALVGYMTPGGDPVQKISIIPRAAGALGYTLQMPLEDRYLLSRDELLDRVHVLLGGRAAEAVVFESVSTGASDDLEKATSIVRDMLIRYGMSDRAPNVSLVARSGSGYLGPGFEQAQYSQDLAQALDDEVIALLGHAFEQARSLLISERPRLEALASALLQAEELDRDSVITLLGEHPTVAPWR